MISYYFGYMPISTVNGVVNDDTIEKIKELSGDDIKDISTVYNVVGSDTIIEVTDGKDFIIPSTISEEELSSLIESGNKYADIADDNNNCVVLMIPFTRYTSSRFDIIDERFGQSIKDSFCRVNCVSVNCAKYVLLCMFDNKWAYSRIGKDKIISPLKLIMKL